MTINSMMDSVSKMSKYRLKEINDTPEIAKKSAYKVKNSPSESSFYKFTNFNSQLNFDYNKPKENINCFAHVASPIRNLKASISKTPNRIDDKVQLVKINLILGEEKFGT